MPSMPSATTPIAASLADPNARSPSTRAFIRCHLCAFDVAHAVAWLVPGSLAALPCRAACPGALTLPLTVRQILPGVWSPATIRGRADDVTNALQLFEDSNNALLR